MHCTDVIIINVRSNVRFNVRSPVRCNVRSPVRCNVRSHVKHYSLDLPRDLTEGGDLMIF